MTRISVIIVVLYGFGSVVVCADDRARLSPSELQDSTKVDVSSDCGAKSLFLYCRALGLRVTEESVARHCRIQSNGMSLADLSTAAAELGLKLDGVFANSDELEQLPKPMIALLEPDSLDGGVGHFVVVLNVVDGQATIADPRIVSVVSVPLTAFSRASSGCYLIHSRGLGRFAMTLVGITCVGAGLLLFFWRRGVPRRRPVMCAGILILIAGCGDSGRNAEKYVPVRFLKVDREFHDLGAIEGSLKKTTEFRLTNTGTVPLTMEISKSCGCVDATFRPPMPLAPSQETTLAVMIDASGKRAGHFSESIFVRPREIPEEICLNVAGRVEGVWVDGSGLTLHASDQALPNVDLQGYFVSKKPAIEFRDVTLDSPDLAADVTRRVADVKPDVLGGYRFRWSIPLVAKSENWRTKFGQRLGQMRVLVAGREQELRLEFNILP